MCHGRGPHKAVALTVYFDLPRPSPPLPSERARPCLLLRVDSRLHAGPPPCHIGRSHTDRKCREGGFMVQADSAKSGAISEQLWHPFKYLVGRSFRGLAFCLPLAFQVR